MSPQLSTQCDIPLGIERQLIEMGIIPSSPLEAISVVCHRQPDRHMRMAKGFYDDPRDENGEVSF